MIWSVIQVVCRQGINFFIFAILALFLDPKDFGVLGMVMVWIGFMQVFSEVGFGAALIQRQNADSKHFSTIFFINISIGALLTVIGILFSWPCAWFFKTPAVQPIMAVLSFGFIINSFSLTQMVILQKELRFRELAKRDISAALIGGVLGIIFAYFKFGVWSLVAQSLTTYLIGSILLWFVSEWRPAFKEFSFQCVRDLWPYSSKIFAFQIFKFFTQNIDKIIIGYFLGSVALGLYTFAYKFVVYPISMLSGAIGNYLFPQFSKIQDNLTSIKYSYLFISKATNCVVAPLMVIVMFLSPTLIPIIFGQKWIQAIPLIQIFSILGIIAPWTSYIGQEMKALNRPGWLFNWSIFITVVESLFICIGIYFKGIVGVSLGITAAYVFSIPVIFGIDNKLIQINVKETLNSFSPSIFSILLTGLVLWIGKSEIFPSNTTSFISVILIFSLYAIYLKTYDKSFIICIFKTLDKHTSAL
jgi:O-antigen/teichoic acid export membrane protein